MKQDIAFSMKHFVFSLFISLAILTAATCPAAASTSSIIIDAWSGEVLSASGADTQRYPASLTKLMTLYITFDALEKGIIKLDDRLPVSRNAANRSPSKLGVRAGETISVRTAVMALIIKSANDCATVLAEGLGYTEENFALTMTKVARELGMKNTTFKNASGLPNRAQKTTARDMALLGAAVYHHFPQYYKLFSATKFEYQGRTYYTHNHLLKNFDGADGMKTGFTNAAGYNIVTSAERNGKRVIAVTMGHNSAKLRDRQIAKLMDKGLTRLAMADDIADSAAETPLSETSIGPENAWGIQIGAFSNYTKARNYALEILDIGYSRLENKPVAVEPYQTGNTVVYRSQILGLNKNDAEKICNSLKKSNKSCIVVAVKGSEDSDQPQPLNRELILAHKL